MVTEKVRGVTREAERAVLLSPGPLSSRQSTDRWRMRVVHTVGAVFPKRSVIALCQCHHALDRKQQRMPSRAQPTVRQVRQQSRLELGLNLGNAHRRKVAPSEKCCEREHLLRKWVGARMGKGGHRTAEGQGVRVSLGGGSLTTSCGLTS